MLRAAVAIQIEMNMAHEVICAPCGLRSVLRRRGGVRGVGRARAAGVVRCRSTWRWDERGKERIEKRLGSAGGSWPDSGSRF